MPKQKVKKTKEEKLASKIKMLENLGKQYSGELIAKQTTWEKILYTYLKDLHYKFKFQVPVVVNKTVKPKLFILDFLLTDYNLIIEADSVKHHTSKSDVKSDNYRSKLLKKEGYYILRLTNKQVSLYSKEDVNDIIQTKIKCYNIQKK